MGFDEKMSKELMLLFKYAIPGLFYFIFAYSMQLAVKNDVYKNLLMIGSELWTSDDGSKIGQWYRK